MKDLAIEILDIYYSFHYGMPDDSIFEHHKNIVQYLIECEISNEDILSFLNSHSEYESIDNNFPENYWDKSLLEKDKFYYHSELKLFSKPSSWEKENKFYMEPKIVFTHEHLLEYFIEKSKMKKEWVNTKKELGTIKYLLDDFRKYDFIEPVDFFLHICDYAIAKSPQKFNSVFDICDFESEYIGLLEMDIRCVINSKNNVYVWR